MKSKKTSWLCYAQDSLTCVLYVLTTPLMSSLFNLIHNLKIIWSVLFQHSFGVCEIQHELCTVRLWAKGIDTKYKTLKLKQIILLFYLFSLHFQLLPSLENCMQTNRMLHVSAVCQKKRSGRYRSTKDRSFPLTYEMSQPPEGITKTKGWNSWNTCKTHYAR